MPTWIWFQSVNKIWPLLAILDFSHYGISSVTSGRIFVKTSHMGSSQHLDVSPRKSHSSLSTNMAAKQPSKKSLLPLYLTLYQYCTLPYRNSNPYPYPTLFYPTLPYPLLPSPTLPHPTLLLPYSYLPLLLCLFLLYPTLLAWPILAW